MKVDAQKDPIPVLETTLTLCKIIGHPNEVVELSATELYLLYMYLKDKKYFFDQKARTELLDLFNITEVQLVKYIKCIPTENRDDLKKYIADYDKKAAILVFAALGLLKRSKK